MREGLDHPEFGDLPFDHFIMRNWDPASPLSKAEQKRALVEKWVAMGKYGRNDYALIAFEGPLDQDKLPPESDIPRDLLSEDDRALSSMLNTTMWIRTWFGGQDQAGQNEADEAYRRLRERVSGLRDCLDDEFIFEDRNELARNLGTSGSEVNNGVAVGRPGSRPGYLIAAMMHCPELLDGISDDDWRHFSGDEREEEEMECARSQSAMVLVADRKACEEGWLLLLAINHKGQILPFRAREKASMAAQHVVNWMNGQPLSEMASSEDDDVESYVSVGNGWD